MTGFVPPCHPWALAAWHHGLHNRRCGWRHAYNAILMGNAVPFKFLAVVILNPGWVKLDVCLVHDFPLLPETSFKPKHIQQVHRWMVVLHSILLSLKTIGLAEFWMHQFVWKHPIPLLGAEPSTIEVMIQLWLARWSYLISSCHHPSSCCVSPHRPVRSVGIMFLRIEVAKHSLFSFGRWLDYSHDCTVIRVGDLTSVVVEMVWP